MPRRNKDRPELKRCGGTGLVIFKTELEAKIVLAARVWRDKGERRVFPCPYHNHFHLTAQEERKKNDSFGMELAAGH